MSAAAVEQVKQLIDGLSVNEKVGLVEWLGATLGQDLATPSVKRKKRRKVAKSAKSTAATANGSTTHMAVAEAPREERPWTEAEIKALMKPDPKTGAEIAAWLEANPDTGGWGEMDIPDVVEWVKDLRHKISRRQAWDE
jgi:hypothetical protein